MKILVDLVGRTNGMARIAERLTEADRADELRAAMVSELRDRGKITTDSVAAAFQVVPRERFMPADTDLAIAYGFDSSVVTKRDEHGVAISSVSAAYIQARMLEQAELAPGATVLEVGSGGLNAALIATIVGAEGRVVSVDIDPEVARRAAELLDETGLGAQVRILVADAEHGVPGEGRFDAIIVTAGAWDIAPAWLDQLAEDGVLVLPLVMNMVTRTIGFRREGDHLISTSAEVAGFVPMQGDGLHADRVLLVPDSCGHKIRLSFDSGFPGDLSSLDGLLAGGPAEAWSDVTIRHGVSFADLYLWFACYLEGFCQVAADEGTDLAAERGTWFPFGVVRGPGFAHLAVRPALEGSGVEFGARGYGRGGQAAATAMVQQILAWDRHGRRAEPAFCYWPVGSDHSRIPVGSAVMAKARGAVTIAWPAAD